MFNSNKSGFTLFEVLIYSALIGAISFLFVTILITVTKVQVRQTASTEVNQQLNFALQNIQRLIRESSSVDIAAGAPISSLTLRMSAQAKDPSLIYLSSNKIYLREGTNEPSALTTNNVIVNDLRFTRISNFPGHDSVQLDLTMSYNTQNPQQAFSKTISSAVARVSAATFDSDLVPGSDNSYDIGQSATRWQDLNLSGEIKIGGISGDGTGKVACVKSDGNLGTCANQPNSSGICTCN